MSYKLVDLCFDIPGLGGSEHLVRSAICRAASNEDYSCCPSRSWIADKSRLTERQVQRILPTLIDKGFVTRKLGSGRASSRFTVQVAFIKELISRGDTETPLHGDDASDTGDITTPLQDGLGETLGLPSDGSGSNVEETFAPSLGRQEDSPGETFAPRRGDIDASYIGRICKESVIQSVSESVIGDLGTKAGSELVPSEKNVSVKKSVVKAAKETSLKALLLTLPPWVDREAWGAYLEMRAALKKPMTPGAYHLTIAKLQSFEAQGLSSTEALNNSVENGWTGVFAPKPNNRPAGGATHGTRSTGRTDGNAEATGYRQLRRLRPQ